MDKVNVDTKRLEELQAQLELATRFAKAQHKEIAALHEKIDVLRSALDLYGGREK